MHGHRTLVVTRTSGRNLARARLAPTCLIAAVSAAIVTVTTSVVAAPETIAVVGVEIGGDGAPELQTEFAESVVAGLEDAGTKTIPLETVLAALSSDPQLVGCTSTACLARIGEKLNVDGFVRVRIVAEGAAYSVVLELFSRTELLHRVARACPVCTFKEVNTVTREAARLLVTTASDAPVQVSIRTEPTVARLAIDGQDQGSSPFEGPLSLGPHLIVATTKDGTTIRQRIEVTEETATEPIIIKVGTPVTPKTIIIRETPGKYRTWKWVTVGAAVVAAGTGAYLLSVDGDPSCDTANAQCPELRDTKVAGFVSLGVSAALVGVASYMFWADSKSGRTVEASADVTAESAAVSMRVRF